MKINYTIKDISPLQLLIESAIHSKTEICIHPNTEQECNYCLTVIEKIYGKKEATFNSGWKEREKKTAFGIHPDRINKGDPLEFYVSSWEYKYYERDKFPLYEVTDYIK